jgi:hypothetical protein
MQLGQQPSAKSGHPLELQTSNRGLFTERANDYCEDRRRPAGGTIGKVLLFVDFVIGESMNSLRKTDGAPLPGKSCAACVTN